MNELGTNYPQFLDRRQTRNGGARRMFALSTAEDSTARRSQSRYVGSQATRDRVVIAKPAAICKRVMAAGAMLCRRTGMSLRAAGIGKCYRDDDGC
jgi:hypothetical protein